jgi:hypothetical protein
MNGEGNSSQLAALRFSTERKYGRIGLTNIGYCLGLPTQNAAGFIGFVAESSALIGKSPIFLDELDA